MKLVRHFILLCLLLSCYPHVKGQLKRAKAPSSTYVDTSGVIRWTTNNEEVKGFGVNYTLPFAHGYRSAKRLNIDVKKIIDQDIYHFKKLDFTLYRVHIWDTEISDVKGNLLNNEHLDAFDYLISKLKQQGINYVITPIAYWGNGWPEPDTKTPGFSYKYGKEKALTDDLAIKAQENYLYQFLDHKNPYTGIKYKEDPNVIAFEISNEPHHRGSPKSVSKFIRKMVNSMRSTGTEIPIFYNMSHSVHLADTYFKGGVQGGTFQWYPTGLGYKKELSGNLLPNVDHYNITFDSVFKKHKGAKIVYEFDAADVDKSYIYPAMARSFRTAGIQLATYFSYDPTFLASSNTEYNTHYMNLLYTPKKALSLKICAAIFETMPMYKSYGRYPSNTSFGNTTIRYDKDLALYNSNEKYFYTNTTDTSPVVESTLNEIAGFGNSPIVKYTGKGAYFFDKISNGVWRLEVLPDALRVDNPFGINNLDKKASVLKANEYQMILQLKDVGEAFSVISLNSKNFNDIKVENKSFLVQPGTYIIQKNSAEVCNTPQKTDHLLR